jgi:hypothetical protein
MLDASGCHPQRMLRAFAGKYRQNLRSPTGSKLTVTGKQDAIAGTAAFDARSRTQARISPAARFSSLPLDLVH